MKPFLIYISKIILVVTAIGYGLEPVLDYGLNNLPGSVYEEWKNIVDGEIDANLVVVGSSRGVVSYNPVMLQEQLEHSGYNLSFDAASYNLQQSKLNAYLLNNKMPSIIIQNIDLSHFSKSIVIPFESQFISTINSPNVLEIYKENSGTLKRFRFKGVTKYTMDNRKIKLSISNLLGLNPNYVIKNKGYNAVSKSYTPDYYNLNRLNELDINAKLDGLDKTFDYYKDERFEKTKMYFVWAPEYESRRVLTSDLSQSVKGILKNKIRDNENLSFIDLQKDEIGNSSKYFYDSFHLNETRSKVFTEKGILQIKSL